MVDIEKMNVKYEPTNPIAEFSKSACRFANDLLELSELQAKLAKLDLKDVLHRSMASIVAAVIGTCLLLASLPVMLFGLASWIAWFSEIEPWIAQMAVGGGVAIVSVITIAVAIRRLLRLSDAFQRSARELEKNVEWTKNVIRSRS